MYRDGPLVGDKKKVLTPFTVGPKTLLLGTLISQNFHRHFNSQKTQITSLSISGVQWLLSLAHVATSLTLPPHHLCAGSPDALPVPQDTMSLYPAWILLPAAPPEEVAGTKNLRLGGDVSWDRTSPHWVVQRTPVLLPLSCSLDSMSHMVPPAVLTLSWHSHLRGHQKGAAFETLALQRATLPWTSTGGSALHPQVLRVPDSPRPAAGLCVLPLGYTAPQAPSMPCRSCWDLPGDWSFANESAHQNRLEGLATSPGPLHTDWFRMGTGNGTRSMCTSNKFLTHADAEHPGTVLENHADFFAWMELVCTSSLLYNTILFLLFLLPNCLLLSIYIFLFRLPPLLYAPWVFQWRCWAFLALLTANRTQWSPSLAPLCSPLKYQM